MSLADTTNPFVYFVSPRWLSFQMEVKQPIHTASILASFFSSIAWQEGIEPSAILLHLSSPLLTTVPNTLFTHVPIIPLAFLPWHASLFCSLAAFSKPALAVSMEFSTISATSHEPDPPPFFETNTKFVLETTSHLHACANPYQGLSHKKTRFPSLRKPRFRQEPKQILTIFAMMLLTQTFGESCVPLRFKTHSLPLIGSSPYCVLRELESHLKSSTTTIFVYGASQLVLNTLQSTYPHVQYVYYTQYVATFLRLLSSATPAVFLDLSVMPTLIVHTVT